MVLLILPRKTHCRKGHPLSGDNLLETTSNVSIKGQRICRTCKREREKRSYNPTKRAARHQLAKQRAVA